jgi:transcriptional regulator with GAF, ATPase, and Fis domain
LQRTFGAQHALLAVLKPGDIIEVPIFLEGGELLPPVAPIPMGQGLTSHVIRTREVLVINRDLEGEAQRLGARVIGVMPKSLLAVPLLLGDDTVGVISIQDAEKENAYNETHIRQLTTLAAYIAIKIRNAELLEEAQRRAAELGFLFNVTRAAVAASTLDDALNNVVGILQQEIGGTDAATVYLTEIGKDVLQPHAAIGYGQDIVARYPELDTNSPLISLAIAGNEPVAIADIQTRLEYAKFDSRTHGMVLVPLKAGQALAGSDGCKPASWCFRGRPTKAAGSNFWYAHSHHSEQQVVGTNHPR